MFGKLFAKKPNDKAIRKFWKEFEERIDLYADILENEAEDSEDFDWLRQKIGKSLKLCCLDSTVGYDYRLETSRSPVRLVFLHKNNDYLKAVGGRMLALYPEHLANKIAFAVAE